MVRTKSQIHQQCVVKCQEGTVGMVCRAAGRVWGKGHGRVVARLCTMHGIRGLTKGARQARREAGDLLL